MRNDLILKLFNRAVPYGSKIEPIQVNNFAAELGYLVHPDVCQEDVSFWLGNHHFNYNSTFYKKWNDVTSKSRLELLIDQLIHYSSTYGTNFQGTPYIPNDGAEVPAYEKFTTILPITKEEVIERCETMLFTGIALKQETIDDILAILSSFVHKIDLEKVRNKEARMMLFLRTNQIPENPVEMVRLLVYHKTGKSLLIKNKGTIKLIKGSVTPAMYLLKQIDPAVLAQVFYRFKPILLALRSESKAVKRYINKVRRLAKKHHRPYRASLFENLLSKVDKNQVDWDEVKAALPHLPIFKRVSLLRAAHIAQNSISTQAYLVRNQKLWVKDSPSAPKEQMDKLITTVYTSIVKDMKPKACRIRLPKGVNLVIPTSEKSFLGNYPIGSYVDLQDKDAIVGIHWRGDEGADDIDLSLQTLSGVRMGWDADYHSEDGIVYSGDMTSANPEASELFYAAQGFKENYIVRANVFSGGAAAKFRAFVATQKAEFRAGEHRGRSKPYMIDPNNIQAIWERSLESNDAREVTLGVITKDRFVMASVQTGTGIVSRRNSKTDKYISYILETAQSFVPVEDVLKDAGFTIVQEHEQADIDLSTLSKDSLIDLFSLPLKEKAKVKEAVV